MGRDIIANLKGSSQDAGSLTPQHVLLVDSSGNVISSFGGGTQYTDGDTDSTVTGTAAMGKDPSNNVYALQLDASKNLKITSGLGLPAYDYVSLALTSATVETYTFKTGGSGGSTVATVTITYTDSTKATISSVART